MRLLAQDKYHCVCNLQRKPSFLGRRVPENVSINYSWYRQNHTKKP